LYLRYIMASVIGYSQLWCSIYLYGNASSNVAPLIPCLVRAAGYWSPPQVWHSTPSVMNQESTSSYLDWTSKYKDSCTCQTLFIYLFTMRKVNILPQNSQTLLRSLREICINMTMVRSELDTFIIGNNQSPHKRSNKNPLLYLSSYKNWHLFLPSFVKTLTLNHVSSLLLIRVVFTG
jgi:hypothetical protein